MSEKIRNFKKGLRQKRDVERTYKKSQRIASEVKSGAVAKQLTVTKDGIGPLQMADNMWHIVQSLSNTEWKKKNSQERLADFRVRGFSDFLTKYTIVARYMIVLEQYNSRAFEKYLEKLRIFGFKNQEEWAERQADYIKFMHMEFNPHAPLNGIRGIDGKLCSMGANDVWAEARTNLLKEVNSFKEDHAAAKEEIAIRQEKLDKEYKADLTHNLKNDPKTKEVLLQIYREKLLSEKLMADKLVENKATLLTPKKEETKKSEEENLEKENFEKENLENEKEIEKLGKEKRKEKRKEKLKKKKAH